MFASLAGRDRNARRARRAQRRRASRSDVAVGAHRRWGSCASRSAARTARRPSSSRRSRLDPQNVLAREYLAQHLPDRSARTRSARSATIIDVPNLVPDYADIYFHIASLMHDLGNTRPRSRTRRAACKPTSATSAKPASTATRCSRASTSTRTSPTTRAASLNASITAGTDTAFASTLLKKIDDGAYGKASASPSPHRRRPRPRRRSRERRGTRRRRALLRVRPVQRGSVCTCASSPTAKARRAPRSRCRRAFRAGAEPLTAAS